jgi:hypothetical protein
MVTTQLHQYYNKITLFKPRRKHPLKVQQPHALPIEAMKAKSDAPELS